MKQIALILPLLFLSCTPERDASQVFDGETSDLSYQELAAQLTVPLYDSIVAELAQFTDQTLPHEAKTLRKSIGKLRMYVDVFPFAYGLRDGQDLWAALRDDLDVGYETVGHFKDIFDGKGLDSADGVTYTAEELADIGKLREEVLAWIVDFTDADVVLDMRSYLGKPEHKFYKHRSQKHYSKFVWGTTDLEPKKSLSGIANISRLISIQLDAAAGEYAEVRHIDKLAKDIDSEELFHDFRKRVRSSMALINEFPVEYRKKEKSAEMIATLTDMVSRFGDLNDVFIKFHKEDNASKRKDLEKRINSGWDELRKWCKERDVETLIAELAANMKF